MLLAGARRFGLAVTPTAASLLGEINPARYAGVLATVVSHFVEGAVFVLVAGLEAVHFVVSHVVQPRMQGRSLNLDPIVVLLALAFWGAVWGVVGAFLSMPLTVVAMAILAEFRASRPIAVLLSSDGKPFADLESEAAAEA